MATYTKDYFTASTNGTPIAITSTNSAGANAIHTCSTNKEEIWLWAYNKTTAAMPIWVEFGDTVSPVVVTVQAQAQPQYVIPGWPLRNGKTVQAYCSTISTAALCVGGYINKIV